MSPMQRRAFIGIVFGIGWSVTAHGQQSDLRIERDISSAQVANCSLTQVPKDAAVNMSHGAYLFIYPKTPGAGYSGCQTVWDERGETVFVLRFQAGKLTRLQAREEAGTNERLACQYRNEALLPGESEDCPDYEALAAGFCSVGGASLDVPDGRDPRGK